MRVGGRGCRERAGRAPHETGSGRASAARCEAGSSALPLPLRETFGDDPLGCNLHHAPQQRVIRNEVAVAQALESKDHVRWMQLDDDGPSAIRNGGLTDHRIARCQLRHRNLPVRPEAAYAAPPFFATFLEAGFGLVTVLAFGFFASALGVHFVVLAFVGFFVVSETP